MCLSFLSGTVADHHAVVGTGVKEANILWHNVDHVRVGEGGGEGEGLQETGQEEKELVLGKLLPEAVSLPNKEGDATVILLEVSFVIKETVRVELLWRVPVLWVVHDVRGVGKDGGALGDRVPVELHLLCGGVRGCVDNTGVTEDLVNDGIHVRHCLPVHKLWCPAPDHTVNLLLHPGLHVGEPCQVVEGKGEDGGGGFRAGPNDVHQGPLDISLAVLPVERGGLVRCLRHLLQVAVDEIPLVRVVVGVNVPLD